jgi:hypothetical protein
MFASGLAYPSSGYSCLQLLVPQLHQHLRLLHVVLELPDPIHLFFIRILLKEADHRVLILSHLTSTLPHIQLLFLKFLLIIFITNLFLFLPKIRCVFLMFVSCSSPFVLYSWNTHIHFLLSFFRCLQLVEDLRVCVVWMTPVVVALPAVAVRHSLPFSSCLQAAVASYRGNLALFLQWCLQCSILLSGCFAFYSQSLWRHFRCCSISHGCYTLNKPHAVGRHLLEPSFHSLCLQLL